MSPGTQIRAARLAAGFSLRQVAQAAQISPSYLSDIENDRRFPADALLEWLSLQLNFDADAVAADAGQIGKRLGEWLKSHPRELYRLRRAARDAANGKETP